MVADLAKDKGPNKRLLANVGAVKPLVELLRSGNAGAQKHASCALWGLTLEVGLINEVVAAGAVEEDLPRLSKRRVAVDAQRAAAALAGENGPRAPRA